MMALVRIIKGIRGDHWHLKENRIYINGEVLKNRAGNPYEIHAKILALYASKFDNIPDNSFLLLEDNYQGSLDGSKFGLVHARDIMGKLRE